MHNDDLYDDIIGSAELELGVSANATDANGKQPWFLISFSAINYYYQL